MKRPALTQQTIAIEWTIDPTDECSDGSRPSKAQVRALAIALGQLMARMERARAKRLAANDAMIAAAGPDKKAASA